MHMVFLSRGFKNLQWYSMTKTVSNDMFETVFICEKSGELKPDLTTIAHFAIQLSYYAIHSKGWCCFMAGSLTALSAHRFGRAKEELQTAELLLKNANFLSSINRSYYSIFHVIRAVNALDGFDSSKHSGRNCTLQSGICQNWRV